VRANLQCEGGLSCWLKQLITGVFVEAIRQANMLEVAFRPDRYKFDNVTTEIRFDLVEYGDLHIGDQIEITDRVWYCDLLSDDALNKAYYYFNQPFYIVAAFLQPKGYFIGTNRNFAAREIFCSLLFNPSGSAPTDFDENILHPKNIVRRDNKPDGPIALFWTKGLRLSQNQ
jgi:hypothetical protein